jgi:hypothetical protein
MPDFPGPSKWLAANNYLYFLGGDSLLLSSLFSLCDWLQEQIKLSVFSCH